MVVEAKLDGMPWSIRSVVGRKLNRFPTPPPATPPITPPLIASPIDPPLVVIPVTPSPAGAPTAPLPPSFDLAIR